MAVNDSLRRNWAQGVAWQIAIWMQFRRRYFNLGAESQAPAIHKLESVLPVI
jgi:hypothetical protein